MKRPIDIHCHLFNRKEASLLMIFDIIQLIRNAEIVLSKDDAMGKHKEEAKQMTKSAKSSVLFFLTVLKTPQKLLKTMRAAEKDFLFAPLMLDLYWILQYSQDEKSFVEKQESSFLPLVFKELDKIASSLQRVVQQRNVSSERRKLSLEMKRLIVSVKNALTQENKLGQALRTLLTDNFANQEKQLVDLYHHHEDELFPFFSVDPRRTTNYKLKRNGQYDLSLLTKRLKINGGIFSGFKLYTPCGYSPTHPMLMALYEYCEKNQVPVIAHCSGSGVTTFASNLYVEGHIYKDGKLIEHKGIWQFDDNKLASRKRILEHSERLNHPMLWEHVLKNFPNLKIDLAHFGHLPNSWEWTDYIFNLLKQKNEDGEWTYPNLYTDLACIPHIDTLKKIRENYFLDTPALQSRFLYGSDYYMNLVYLNNLEEYYNNFISTFAPDEFQLISIDNTYRFLGI